MKRNVRSTASLIGIAIGVTLLGIGVSTGSGSVSAKAEKVCVAHLPGGQPVSYLGYDFTELPSSALDGSGHSGHAGDIIAPFDGLPSGLNWVEPYKTYWLDGYAAGQCPDTPPPTTAAPTTAAPTTAAPTTAAPTTAAPTTTLGNFVYIPATTTTTTEPTTTTAATTTSLASQAPVAAPTTLAPPLPVTGAGSNGQLAVLGTIMILLGLVMLVGTRRPLSVA